MLDDKGNPVILVTGYRDEMAQVIEAALEIDAYTCLYKPLQIEELLEILTEIQHQELAHVLGRSACNRIPPLDFQRFQRIAMGLPEKSIRRDRYHGKCKARFSVNS